MTPKSHAKTKTSMVLISARAKSFGRIRVWLFSYPAIRMSLDISQLDVSKRDTGRRYLQNAATVSA